MKKKLIVLVLVLSLGLIGLIASEANAICVQLDGFCDRIELNIDPNKNMVGTWDINCDGAFANPVMGSKKGLNVVADLMATHGLMFEHTFNTQTMAWGMWSYDGVSPSSNLWLTGPFSYTAGSCPLVGANADAPRSTD